MFRTLTSMFGWNVRIQWRCGCTTEDQRCSCSGGGGNAWQNAYVSSVVNVVMFSLKKRLRDSIRSNVEVGEWGSSYIKAEVILLLCWCLLF